MTGLADRLARRSSTDRIYIPFVCIVRWKRLNVAPSRDAWPPFRQYAAGITVDFHLPLADHPGTLEAQVKTADA